MPRQYLYNVEFTVDDLDLWCYPDELATTEAEELPTFIRFKMNPLVCLEINEDEFLDQINCDKKVVKNSLFCLNDDQVKTNVDARIIICKLQCIGNEVIIGSYTLPQLHNSFNQLMEQFDKHAALQTIDNKCGSPDIQPCTEIVKELVQLVNQKNQPSGSLHYSLRLTCFGPTMSKEPSRVIPSRENKKKAQENSCLDRAATPCHSKESEYDEYSAEVNGNQLIVRIHKGNPHLVTRVFEGNPCEDGNKRDKNLVSIYGCDQQIDFKFAEKNSCGDNELKSGNCCGPASMLTDFQRQTSCIGQSFKNSCCLPVIRGNLKYPGRIDDSSIEFNLFENCNTRVIDKAEKYKKKPQALRSACLQVDEQTLTSEPNVKRSLPKGIEICKKGCTDPDTDVFILKIGSKRSDKKGRKNEIELEMRTPKGPDNEIKKKETREVQVNEKDFEEAKPLAEPKNLVEPKKSVDAAPSTRKGFVKKRK